MTTFEQGRLSAFIDCLTVILKHHKDPTTEDRNPLRVLKDVTDEVSAFADAISLPAVPEPMELESEDKPCRRCAGRRWIQPVVGQPKPCPECGATKEVVS